jgi:hypothetical protein
MYVTYACHVFYTVTVELTVKILDYPFAASPESITGIGTLTQGNWQKRSKIFTLPKLNPYSLLTH